MRSERGGAVSVAAVVPAHAPGDALDRCLASVAALDPPPDRFIVVNDGDDPAVERAARSLGAELRTTHPARGPAAARNLAVADATAEVLLFLDSDVSVPPDTIALLREVFADPNVAAVIGSYDNRPSDPGFFSQYRNLLHHHIHQISRVSASTFWSGCGAIRRVAFEAVGGFCRSYDRPCIEDIDLGRRLTDAGYAIRLLKHWQCTHHKRWTFWSMLRTDIFDRALPWTRMIVEQRRLPNDLNLRLSARLSSAAVGLLLAAIAAAWWLPLLASGLAALCIIALLALNHRFYALLLRRRGVLFTLAVIPCHWLYFLYSAAAFAFGQLRYRIFPMPRADGAPEGAPGPRHARSGAPAAVEDSP